MDLFRFALIRTSVSFFAGLLLAVHLSWFPNIGFVLGSIAAFLLVKSPAFRGALLLLATLFTGIFVFKEHFRQPDNHYELHLQDRPQKVMGIVVDRIKNGTASQRYIVGVKRIDSLALTGKMLLNVKGLDAPLSPGTPVGFLTKVQRHKPPTNPGQFDYGQYLLNQKVYAQCWINNDHLATGNPQRNLRWICNIIRSKILTGLRDRGMAEPELQVAHALILGQKQELDRETVRDYQLAGAVHILAVSGLHVGFVMLIVNFFMKPIPKNRAGRRTRFLVQIAALWGFAILTGLSPSVVRSAAMFSLLAAGESLRRATNRFHTLFASAFLILLVNPALLFEVGFQLSYAAVLFIIWLYPTLRSWWQPSSRATGYFWDIAAVSIAAQIGTLPLCLYYFHQFPGLFLLTNLAIIPMVTIIMTMGIGVMIMALAGTVPAIAVDCLEGGIAILNKTVNYLARADLFVWANIPFSLPMAILLSIVIIAFTLIVQKLRANTIAMALASIIAMQVSVIVSKKRLYRSAELIVFHDSKSTLITIRQGCRLTAYGEDPNDYHLDPVIRSRYIDSTVKSKLPRLLWHNGYKILVLDSTANGFGVKPDIVVLRESPKINLERALDRWKPKMLIADGTNYKSYIKRWQATSKQKKIPFHYTGEKGSFNLME